VACLSNLALTTVSPCPSHLAPTPTAGRPSILAGWLTSRCCAPRLPPVMSFLSYVPALLAAWPHQLLESTAAATRLHFLGCIFSLTCHFTFSAPRPIGGVPSLGAPTSLHRVDGRMVDRASPVEDWQFPRLGGATPIDPIVSEIEQGTRPALWQPTWSGTVQSSSAAF
jgi:hypothetical protein